MIIITYVFLRRHVEEPLSGGTAPSWGTHVLNWTRSSDCPAKLLNSLYWRDLLFLYFIAPLVVDFFIRADFMDAKWYLVIISMISSEVAIFWSVIYFMFSVFPLKWFDSISQTVPFI